MEFNSCSASCTIQRDVSAAARRVSSSEAVDGPAAAGARGRGAAPRDASPQLSRTRAPKPAVYSRSND